MRRIKKFTKTKVNFTSNNKWPKIETWEWEEGGEHFLAEWFYKDSDTFVPETFDLKTTRVTAEPAPLDDLFGNITHNQ